MIVPWQPLTREDSLRSLSLQSLPCACKTCPTAARYHLGMVWEQNAWYLEDATYAQYLSAMQYRLTLYYFETNSTNSAPHKLTATVFDESGLCLTINFREAVWDFIDLCPMRPHVCKHVVRINALVRYDMTQMGHSALDPILEINYGKHKQAACVACFDVPLGGNINT